MSTALTAYTDATAISAAALRTTSRGIEAWLNETMVAADVQSSTAWCTASHLFPPFVYGDPTPRFDAQTTTIHHRQNLFTQRDRTLISHESSAATLVSRIPRLATRVRVVDATTPVVIKASWFSYCQGGTIDAVGTEGTQIGYYDLFIDNAVQLGTRRRLYLTRGWGYFAKKQHGVIIHTSLTAGTHDVGIYLTRNSAGSGRRVFVETRGFEVSVEYR